MVMNVESSHLTPTQNTYFCVVFYYPILTNIKKSSLTLKLYYPTRSRVNDEHPALEGVQRKNIGVFLDSKLE